MEKWLLIFIISMFFPLTLYAPASCHMKMFVQVCLENKTGISTAIHVKTYTDVQGMGTQCSDVKSDYAYDSTLTCIGQPYSQLTPDEKDQGKSPYITIYVNQKDSKGADNAICQKDFNKFHDVKVIARIKDPDSPNKRKIVCDFIPKIKETVKARVDEMPTFLINAHATQPAVMEVCLKPVEGIEQKLCAKIAYDLGGAKTDDPKNEIASAQSQTIKIPVGTVLNVKAKATLYKPDCDYIDEQCIDKTVEGSYLNTMPNVGVQLCSWVKNGGVYMAMLNAEEDCSLFYK